MICYESCHESKWGICYLSQVFNDSFNIRELKDNINWVHMNLKMMGMAMLRINGYGNTMNCSSAFSLENYAIKEFLLHFLFKRCGFSDDPDWSQELLAYSGYTKDMPTSA